MQTCVSPRHTDMGSLRSQLSLHLGLLFSAFCLFTIAMILDKDKIFSPHLISGDKDLGPLTFTELHSKRTLTLVILCYYDQYLGRGHQYLVITVIIIFFGEACCHLWRSKDILQELVLSFHFVVSWMEPKQSCLVASLLTC